MQQTIEKFDGEALLLALRAVAEPTRLRIFAFAVRADLSVTDFTELLKQSQPRISRHLKILCDAGVLERLREATFAFYRIAEPIGRLLADKILPLYQFDDADGRSLDQLKLKRHKIAAPLEAENAEQLRRLRAYYPAEKTIDQSLLQSLPVDQIDDLLDIGTGVGHMLSLFGPRVTHAMGIDLSRDMLSLARAKLMLSDLQNCRVQHADMYNLPLDAASFDAVTIHHVLHFAERPADAIVEAARVLRPGGRLVIVDFLAHDLKKLQAEFGHRWLGFSAADLLSWCVAANLEPGEPKTIAESGKPLKVIIATAHLKAANHLNKDSKKRRTAA